ncbi:MAG: hypothetical protein DKM22_03990 [Candidatus Melainabacteria bacterium]|nr:MAG: hypothetical protein DKM22_03990 [Candidatus Melainabacteria bacterium]
MSEINKAGRANFSKMIMATRQLKTINRQINVNNLELSYLQQDKNFQLEDISNQLEKCEDEYGTDSTQYKQMQEWATAEQNEIADDFELSMQTLQEESKKLESEKEYYTSQTQSSHG